MLQNHELYSVVHETISITRLLFNNEMKHVVLRFHTCKQKLKVWINNQLIRSHASSYVPEEIPFQSEAGKPVVCFDIDFRNRYIIIRLLVTCELSWALLSSPFVRNKNNSISLFTTQLSITIWETLISAFLKANIKAIDMDRKYYLIKKESAHALENSNFIAASWVWDTKFPLHCKRHIKNKRFMSQQNNWSIFIHSVVFLSVGGFEREI